MAENPRAVRLRVGRNVRQLRLSRGWSQERLAELVGNTYKHIGQIERGEVNVGLDVLAAIAVGLSVNVAELFGPAAGDASGPRAYAITQRDLDQIEAALRTVRRVKQGGRRRERPSAD